LLKCIRGLQKKVKRTGNWAVFTPLSYMSLKGIKSKIRGIEKTHKVTRAMEAVSAVKMRKSQERAILGRPYAIAALSILRRLSGSPDASGHPLLEEREVKRLVVILVTSDKGLAGNFNSAVIKAVEKKIQDTGLPLESIGIVAIGRKGYEFFSRRGFQILEYIPNLGDDGPVAKLDDLTKKVLRLFTSNSYDQCLLAYSHFSSTFEQRAVVRRILPISVREIIKTVHDITPEHGRYSDRRESENRQELYTVEPDHETVLNELLPHLLQVKIYHSLLESSASEHSARMVAMKNASDKASELSKELTLSFNKARQSEITSEVSELVGGMEAMAKK